ncbi:hypothetical protein [Saccharospirillum alexandrii]|uniref:hypothetical protein n=1 Tax=Saccharospirillum alexandrii TaxID=2448477 RepID=UPI0037364028
MELTEPNPYTRNLIIISLLFIFYNWLDLSPPELTTFNILFNKFEIGNKDPLSVIPWIFYFWFLFRFIQESQNNSIDVYKARVTKLPIPKRLEYKLRSLADEHYKDIGKGELIEEKNITEESAADAKIEIHYLNARESLLPRLYYSATYQSNNNGRREGKFFIAKINFKDGIPLLLAATLKYAYKENCVATELVPYFLAYTAFLSGMEIVLFK